MPRMPAVAWLCGRKDFVSQRTLRQWRVGRRFELSADRGDYIAAALPPYLLIQAVDCRIISAVAAGSDRSSCGIRRHSIRLRNQVSCGERTASAS